ncbi:hypothetical protein [Accumulibacter sp.]|uniref:hypothetical protein n=1 Tax=Accumulibacter sp. TaxID=2053492 RepID=UPI0025828B04|nr:hypothetical protein [Accumulibacter sp.]
MREHDLAERVTTLQLADDTCKAQGADRRNRNRGQHWHGLGADVGQHLKPARLSRVTFVR